MALFLFTSDVLLLWHYGQSYGKEPSKEFVYSNNNIYLLQLGCYRVAVVILHVKKT